MNAPVSQVFLNNALLRKMKMKIGTHNGTFHCDEVLACFLLRQLPEYKDAEILRSRDASLLKQCDVVVDVGGEYDPSQQRYDHHQRSFVESFHSLCPEKRWVTKLSSAGLIYLHFGRRVLEQLTQLKQDEPQLEVLYDQMYQNFVEEVDAVDNGISQCDGEVDPSGEIVLLAQGGCPWKEHLFVLEKELKVDVSIKFVLYSDQSGHWRVQCVPAGLNTFQNRLSLLEEWRGVRDEALSELSGIPGCIFVHASGFIGGNRTQEGALEMAKRTLQTAPRPLPSA
uniref:Uncharacterized protein n=1 Tax=Cyprinus carpio carpio TaxID=630221 RepID=A0A8C1BJJ1_CYPCA